MANGLKDMIPSRQRVKGASFSEPSRQSPQTFAIRGQGRAWAQIYIFSGVKERNPYAWGTQARQLWAQGFMQELTDAREAGGQGHD